jgi:transposase
LLRVRAAHRPIDRSIDDLFAFPHVQDWVADELRHATKREAFEMKAERARETSELTISRNALKKERAECQELLAWSEEYKEAFEAALGEIKTRTTALKAEKKKLLMRTRKHHLYPTRQQKKTLRQFFGTCRWTYNQAVAHFQATSEADANLLTTLYVTKTSAATRRYPDGMSPPPEWVFNTPSSMRNNIMRTFQTNVKSAFSNLRNGNINKFKMRFISKKSLPTSRSLKILELPRSRGRGARSSCLSGLKGIRVNIKGLVSISSEADLLYSNGFYYVAIPECVASDPYECCGRCVALDPGLKVFMTGVDLEGNTLEFGRNNRFRLNEVWHRASAAQHVMSKFKNRKGESKRWQYRAYAKAKRTFTNCVAKLKNLVKDLHYKTCAYLTWAG